MSSELSGAHVPSAFGPMSTAVEPDVERTLRKQNRLFALLVETAGFILSTEDPDELVRGVYFKIKEHLEVDTYFNYMVNSDGTALGLASCHGIAQEVADRIHRLEFGQAICGTVALIRQPIVATHIQESSDPISGLVRSLGIRAYACNPLMAGDRLLGTLSFASKTRDSFGEDELDFFRTVSRYVELAKERIRITTESEDRARKLAETEDRLRIALEATAQGAWDFCPGSGKWEYSARLSRLFGFRGAKNFGYKQLLARVHPDDRRRVVDAVRAAFDVSGSGHFECECRVVRQDSSVRWLASRGQAFFAEVAGRLALTRFVGTVRDETDQTLLREKVSQTAKLESVGLLAGGIAHDFNNLLTGIMGNSSLAMDIIGPDHEMAPLLAAAVKSSERAADLTRQLLAYAGKARGNVQPVNLSDSVREVSDLIRSSIPRHVEISMQLEDGLPNVRADATQIHQIVMNLIINGAEAVPADRKGMVTVRTALKRIDASYIAQITAGDELTPGEYVSLEVEDTGTGMDEATKARIFDPFFTTKNKGRGLGLSAVVGIVRAHKGAIRLYSVAGKGTVFRVLLPQSSASAEPEPLAKDECLTGAGTVLVVDDDEAIRDVTAIVLKHYGYDVLTAGNGQQAIDLLRTDSAVDAIVLDLNMPVMSGEEALPLLTSIRPGLKVIVCTGYGDVQTAETYSGGSIAGFIQKPFTAVALARQIRNVMAAETSQSRQN